jgi:hypothetical protein
LRVLVACECSGTVRDAFIAAGHTALSCDLQPSEVNGPHYRGNVLDILDYGWDLLIAHPPCTALSVSGSSHFEKKLLNGEQKKAIEFFNAMAAAKDVIPKVAIENPKSIMSTLYMPPSQIIHPWQFGHPEKKLTCLWLHGLPDLVPTCIIDKHLRTEDINNMRSSKTRAKTRSRTFEGIAAAMAAQWGK